MVSQTVTYSLPRWMDTLSLYLLWEGQTNWLERGKLLLWPSLRSCWGSENESAYPIYGRCGSVDRYLDMFSCLPIFEQDETNYCPLGLTGDMANACLKPVDGWRVSKKGGTCCSGRGYQWHGSCESIGWHQACCFDHGLASFSAGRGLGTRLAMARAGCQSHGSCESVGRYVSSLEPVSVTPNLWPHARQNGAIQGSCEDHLPFQWSRKVTPRWDQAESLFPPLQSE